MGIEKIRKKEWAASGIPISNGLALGRASIVRRFASDPIKNSSIDSENIKEEIVRLKQVLQILLVVLQCSEDFLLKHSNTAAADVFALQRAFLMDPILTEQLYQVIEKKLYSAETALQLVLDDYAQRFATMDNQRVKERASDIRDLKNMLLDALHNPLLLLPKKLRKNRGAQDRIAVAVDLTPRLVIEQNAMGIKGIITENGGRTSHAAILCQALGIPAIAGIKDVTGKIEKDSRVLINGTEGKLIDSPSRKTVFRVLCNKLINQIPKQLHLASDHVCPLLVMASINFARESRNASNFQAEGIGLYRTEMECIALRRYLTEDEQLYRYMEVLENMEGLPVYIRLMDIGGDKKIFGPEDEQQSPSNSRGAQYLLENPEVLRTQSRAIARASVTGCIHVVYPMITDARQFSLLKDKFCVSISLLKTGAIRHGVMFETPTACKQARDLLNEADFASIGTNDLTEQLFGFNRNSEQAHQAASRPALWEMIELVLRAAKERGKAVLVCGELAKRSEFLNRFIALGVSGICVPLKMIPEIRREMAIQSDLHAAPQTAF